MPLVEVELVTDDEPADGLAAALADALAPVLGAAAGRTWVRLRTLPRDRYAEDGGPLPDEVRPVFVSLLLGRTVAGPALAEEAPRVAAAVAETTGHPVANVHLVYADVRGRVAFGGRLVPPAGG